MRRYLGCGLAALLLAGAAAAQDDPYATARAEAVKACEAIDPEASQSGLIFNPDGFRSFYVRSECLQNAAVRFRDVSLCEGVRQRSSLLFSSWGYSGQQCRTLVARGVAGDRTAVAAIRERYARSGVRPRGLRLEANGNGRDFDAMPELAGDFGHSYQISIELIDAAVPVTLHRSTEYLDGESNLRFLLRQDDVRQHVPGFALHHPYHLRLSVALDVGSAEPSGLGLWSHAFLEKAFPSAERIQSITVERAFSPR